MLANIRLSSMLIMSREIQRLTSMSRGVFALLIKYIVTAIKSVQNHLVTAQINQRKDLSSVKIIQMLEALSTVWWVVQEPVYLQDMIVMFNKISESVKFPKLSYPQISLISYATKSSHQIVKAYHQVHHFNATMELAAKTKINARVIMFALLEPICVLIFHVLVS